MKKALGGFIFGFIACIAAIYKIFDFVMSRSYRFQDLFINWIKDSIDLLIFGETRRKIPSRVSYSRYYTNHEIQIISSYVFGKKWDYSTKTYYVYNNIILDEDDEPIEIEVLRKNCGYGAYPVKDYDTIYVRNYIQKTDYEIINIPEDYFL